MSTIQAIINLLRLKQEVHKDNLTIKNTELDIAEKQEKKSARESGIVTSVSIDDIQTYDPRAKKIKNLISHRDEHLDISGFFHPRKPKLIRLFWFCIVAAVLLTMVGFYIAGRYL